MLPRKNRIPRKLFGELQKGRSRVFRSPLFTARITLFPRSASMPDSKASFVVSKKVAKRAVQRNLLRRRGYAIFQELLLPKNAPQNSSPKDSSPKDSSGAYIFFLTKEAARAPYEELKREIAKSVILL